MSDGESPLELSREEMSRLVDEAVDRVIDHVASLPEQPAADTEGVEGVVEALDEPLPRAGSSYGELLEFLFEEAIPRSTNNPHPGFMAYIPGGGLYHSAVADFVADATNRYVGAWHTAPALAKIEATVLDWFCEIVGYPEEAFGLLTTGGSMANLVGIDVARREMLPDEFLDGVIYTSDQAHHSVVKTARTTGFSHQNICSIPTDDAYRLDLDVLREAVERHRTSTKRKPFLVIANAGTTNTGAVDDLAALADLCDEHDLWLHADAAYGGFFALTERGRRRLEGLERCDSITLDPHKGLFLPYGTGALVVRDGEALSRTYATEAEYIPDPDEGSEVIDFAALGPELSRDFRGLRVWLPMKMHGADVFRDQLDEKIDLAERAADQLREIDAVEVLAEPQLSTLAFRVVSPTLDSETTDELNREVLEAVNRRGRVHLSGTRLDGHFVLRISVLSFRTHEKQLEHALEDLESAIRERVD